MFGIVRTFMNIQKIQNIQKIRNFLTIIITVPSRNNSTSSWFESKVGLKVLALKVDLVALKVSHIDSNTTERLRMTFLLRKAH